jgi:hypothetical protein
MRSIVKDKGSTVYLNSGDWVENLSSLEWNDGQWQIYQFEDDEARTTSDEEEENEIVDSLDIAALIEKITH